MEITKYILTTLEQMLSWQSILKVGCFHISMWLNNSNLSIFLLRSHWSLPATIINLVFLTKKCLWNYVLKNCFQYSWQLVLPTHLYWPFLTSLSLPAAFFVFCHVCYQHADCFYCGSQLCFYHRIESKGHTFLLFHSAH